MYADNTLQPVKDNQSYVAPDGTKYPKNYPKGEIAGLTLVKETPRPSEAEVYITGFIIDKNYIQVWKTKKKTPEEIQEHKLQAVLNKRASEYPEAGDQLDAIWKQLNQDRLNGKNLIQEADDRLNEVLAVKARNPKPTKEEK